MLRQKVEWAGNRLTPKPELGSEVSLFVKGD